MISKRIIVACLLLVLSATAAMWSWAKYGDPAIVIKNDGLCGMPGSDANGNLIFGGIGQVTTEVENGNKVMLKCKGGGITNLSGRGQNYAEFLCGIITPGGDFVLTDDSHATVSASGVGTLTCTYVKP
jgi:hypothetical protein